MGPKSTPCIVNSFIGVCYDINDNNHKNLCRIYEDINKGEGA